MKTKELANFIKDYLKEHPELMDTYIKAGKSAVNYSMLSLNAFMRHLVDLNGVSSDVNWIPSTDQDDEELKHLKQELNIDQEELNQFEKQYDEDLKQLKQELNDAANESAKLDKDALDDDSDISWAHQYIAKIGDIKRKLGFLNFNEKEIRDTLDKAITDFNFPINKETLIEESGPFKTEGKITATIISDEDLKQPPIYTTVHKYCEPIRSVNQQIEEDEASRELYNEYEENEKKAKLSGNDKKELQNRIYKLEGDLLEQKKRYKEFYQKYIDDTYTNDIKQDLCKTTEQPSKLTEQQIQADKEHFARGWEQEGIRLAQAPNLEQLQNAGKYSSFSRTPEDVELSEQEKQDKKYFDDKKQALCKEAEQQDIFNDIDEEIKKCKEAGDKYLSELKNQNLSLEKENEVSKIPEPTVLLNNDKNKILQDPELKAALANVKEIINKKMREQQDNDEDFFTQEEYGELIQSLIDDYSKSSTPVRDGIMKNLRAGLKLLNDNLDNLMNGYGKY